MGKEYSNGRTAMCTKGNSKMVCAMATESMSLKMVCMCMKESGGKVIRMVKAARNGQMGMK